MTAHASSSARRRLLQVVTSTERRGAEVFGTQLGQALAKRGWETRTLALFPGRSDDPLPVPALGNRPLTAATLLALRRAAAGTVAVAHGSTTLPACALATPGVAPFVYRNIGDPTYWASSTARRLRVGLLLRRARAVVALSEPMAGVLARSFRVRRDRLFVIPNAVPAAAFPPVDAARRSEARSTLGLSSTGPVVAYLGALSAEKDVGAAVDAVARLEGVVLLVAGDGPERAALEREAAALAAGRVHFLGTGASTQSVLAAADALVLPSRTEGMPGVLIEAGFSAIPVVATDVGAVNQVVIDGKTGILVPPGDPRALAQALDAVLADPGDMGGEARTHCLDRFDLEMVACDWDRLLQHLC